VTGSSAAGSSVTRQGDPSHRWVRRTPGELVKCASPRRWACGSCQQTAPTEPADSVLYISKSSTLHVGASPAIGNDQGSGRGRPGAIASLIASGAELASGLATICGLSLWPTLRLDHRLLQPAMRVRVDR
jgi:hypothetical protein